MNNLNATDKPFSKEHESVDILLARQETTDTREYIDVKLFCKAEVKMRAVEYLNGSTEKVYDNGDFILHLHLPESEHLWFGTILALGSKVIVLEPEALKERLRERAREILDTYK